MKATVYINLIAFTCNSTAAVGQLKDFNTQRTKTDQKLMLSLGSWASANIVGSGIGWLEVTAKKTNIFTK